MIYLCMDILYSYRQSKLMFSVDRCLINLLSNEIMLINKMWIINQRVEVEG